MLALAQEIVIMGNKSKYYRNSNRHVFKILKKDHDKSSLTRKQVNKQLKGNRIISMDKLQSYANDVTDHGSKCNAL